MIEDPWLILMVNRRRLGAAVYAVARGKREDGRPRRTLRVSGALRFATERRATNAARKLAEHHGNELLFATVKLGDGDLPRPKERPRFRQIVAFAIDE